MSYDLTQYKDIAGKPGEGIHSYSVANIAIVDVALTGVASYGVSKLTGWSFFPTFAGAVVVGELMHYAFGVETRLLKALGVTVPESQHNNEGETPKCPMRS
jgi:hypothetical protein